MCRIGPVENLVDAEVCQPVLFQVGRMPVVLAFAGI